MSKSIERVRMSASKSVEWTLPMLKRFRRDYRAAARDGKETFMFDGHEFLVTYAMYLIEFLETKFDIPPMKE